MEQIDFLENLKYPIGKFQKPMAFDSDLLQQYIKTIADFPEKLQKTIENSSLQQLNFRYRPQGWRVKQIVHHCADSHTNAFLRLKLALTENNPTISPYNELLWSELCDGVSDDLNASFQIIFGIHNRWVCILKSMTFSDFNKTYFHPASKSTFNLFEATSMYDWHCKHHLKHIEKGLLTNGKYN